MILNKIFKNTLLVLAACLVLSACATKKEVATDATISGQMQSDVYTGTDTVEYLADGVKDRVFFATNVLPNGETGGFTRQLDLRVGPLHRETAWLSGWDSGRGLNCLTHALPRCLPTPTEEADGNGYGVITGRSDPLGRRLE